MEVVPCFIELFLPDFELFMCFLHIHTVIFVWSSCHHRYEVFLALDLFIHIGFSEEG